MSLTSHVQIGVWVDWSHNPLRGATLTLDSRDGAILLSLLTLWVGLAGTFFWTIVAFFLHQARARRAEKLSQETSQDGLWNQQQLILRNTGSAYLVAWHMARGYYFWRNATTNALRRSLAPCTIALFVAIVFSAAGIFSSQVINATSNDVLLISPTCGFWGKFDANDSSASSDINQKILNETVMGNSYARACYENSSSALQCGMFVQPRFNYTEDKNASCPFASGMCGCSDTAALQFDTGHLNSLEAFGLNSPKNDRVTYRKVSTCAPLVLTKSMYTRNNETRNMFSMKWEEEFMYYKLGDMGPDTNYTFAYATHDVATVNEYTVRTVFAEPQGVWAPIKELNRTSDSDVGITGIAANFITYNAPVDDPVFSAHWSEKFEGIEDIQYYSDSWMNFIACTDQHQICYPDESSVGACTRLTGIGYIEAAVNSIAKSDIQEQISIRLVASLVGTHILFGAYSRGSSALRAQESASLESISMPLPNNQWMIECRSWFNTALAKLQRSVVDFAIGPAHDDYPQYYITNPGLPAWDRVCRSQRIKNPGGFQNFSLLGVAFIFIVGSIIIFLGLCIDKIVSVIQRIFFPKAYGRLAWALDSKFQLQRMAFEGAGWNQWEIGTSEDAVPVTKPDSRIGRYTRFDGEWATVTRPSDEDSLIGSTIVFGKTDRS